MPVVRYLVDDIDASTVIYAAPGFRLKDRWGLPIAILKRKTLSIERQR